MRAAFISSIELIVSGSRVIRTLVADLRLFRRHLSIPLQLLFIDMKEIEEEEHQEDVQLTRKRQDEALRAHMCLTTLTETCTRISIRS